MINFYFKLEILSDEVREFHKIKSKNRFDCTLCNRTYEGISHFINKKGMFFLYLSTANKFIKAHQNRISDFVLTGGGTNFTSLYNEGDDFRYYGYPNENIRLKNGSINPILSFKNDVYLFELSKDFRYIDIFIIRNQKGFISNLYQMFIDGEFDDEMQVLKDSAIPFFKYDYI